VVASGPGARELRCSALLVTTGSGVFGSTCRILGSFQHPFLLLIFVSLRRLFDFKNPLPQGARRNTDVTQILVYPWRIPLVMITGSAEPSSFTHAKTNV
jgi:hypothetical protein